MAKTNPTTKASSGTKGRGRTNIPTAGATTRPNVPQDVRREASRPVKAGGGKHRGDRRDTSPTYTTNEKHAARGNTPRKDVSTRAR